MTKFLFSSSTRKGAILGIIGWFLLIGVISSIAPSLSEVTTNEQDEFLPVGAESVEALKLRTEKFPAADGVPALVVFRAETASNALSFAVSQFTSDVRAPNAPDSILSILSPSDSPAVASTLISEDGTTAMVVVTIGGAPSEPEFGETVDWLSEKAGDAGAEIEIDTAITGPAGIINDAVKVFGSIDLRVTLVTVVLVLVLLLVIYRSPLLAVIPLVVIGTALTLSQSVAAILSQQFDLPLNGQVTAIMSVLVFGAGTNYALFIVSRYREELVLNANKWGAMRTTMSNVGPSIAGSAGTTIVAMFALTFASYGSFRSLGPMLAVAIFIVLLSGLLVMPAVIALFGKWVFWPRPLIQQSSIDTSGIWHRIGRLVSRRPLVVFSVTMIGIALATLPSWTIIPSFNFIDGFPDDAESKQGYSLLAESFPQGLLAPTEIFVESGESSISNSVDSLEEFSATLASTPGVLRVIGPTRPIGVPVDESLAAAQGAERFVSVDETTARLELIIDGDPYSAESLELVDDLRSIATKSELSGTPGIRILIGGESAVQADTKASIDADIRWLAPVSLLAILIVLMLLLRSIVAPLYLVFSVIVSFGATFGLSVFAFQQIFGHSGVAYSNGVWMFIFLVALGADYNIFVMSRIREAVQKEGFRDGVATAVGRTGGVVTSAGIILAGTFAVLTTLPLRDIFQLGFAVMLGVLIDTFVVRALLVPSMAAILGEWSWWPRKQKKSIPGSARPDIKSIVNSEF
jgi:RND superfamily putative drug exporter